MNVITETSALGALCERLAKHPFITIDTEFMREKTYYAQLCLIQVASTDEAAIIDPLAEGLDLAPLLELLSNSSVLKVFHAARQDVEIFYALMGSVPAPIFDTQIAAMACGYGDQIGYEPLVKAVTGRQIDKGSRFTDWSRRPLSDKQLAYAEGDVTHLLDVYQSLRDRLSSQSRNEWVASEMDALLDPLLYHTPPETAWSRLKMRNPRPHELGILVEVAAWREQEAQTRDVPRGRILKDDALLEIGRAAPEDATALGRLRAIPNGFERSRSAKDLLAAIAKGKDTPKDKLPTLGKGRPKEPAPQDVVDLLRVLLKRQSEVHGVAPKLLANAQDLDALARSDDADIPALKGWRREVFGDLALRLKRGELALTLTDERVEVLEKGAT